MTGSTPAPSRGSVTARRVAGGLVERAVTDTRPPGVIYSLTPASADLLPILHQLAAWADASLPVGG
jgi:DNA-binding HxlR family transcriptional regulator